MTYSPNWSPGDPLAADEKISSAEKRRIAADMKAAGASQKDLDAYWADDQPA